MNDKTLILVITMLALISTWLIAKRSIIPFAEARMEFASDILSGESEPPYLYRLFAPALHRVVGKLVSPVVESAATRHVLASVSVALVVFWLCFFLFYQFLRGMFSSSWALVGVLLLQVVIPLSVTGYYLIGDFVNVLFFLAGLNLMTRDKHAYVPVVIALGAFNREQIVVLLALHAAHLVSVGGLRKYFYFLLLDGLAFTVVFVGLRLWLGTPPSQFGIALHIAHNTGSKALVNQIVPLWIAQVGVLASLSAIAFRKSNRFFQLSLLLMGPYTVLFFLNGNLWEMAKYLPAFLVFIPMSLQALSGQYVETGIRPIRVGAVRSQPE